MKILIDTNVLARVFQPGHIHRPAAVDSLSFLHTQKNQTFISPQILVEFYAIATRAVNGLNYSDDQAASILQKLSSEHIVIEESPAIFIEWQNLRATHKPRNRLVFDLRHLAVANVAGLDALLTFNDADFSQTPIQILNPFDVLGLPRI